MLKKNIIFSFFLLFYAASMAQTLDEFISKGIKNSPLLKDYQNRIKVTEIDSMLLKAALKPQVNANAQLMYSPDFNGYGYDNAVTNGGNYTAVIGVSQSFFNKRILNANLEAVGIEQQLIKNAGKLSEYEIKNLVTTTYLSALGDQNDISSNLSFLNLMMEEKTILKQLSDQGIYKQTDYLSFIIELESQKILAEQLKIQYDKDIHLLRQICGITDTSRVKLSTPVLIKESSGSISKSLIYMTFTIDSLKILSDKKMIDNKYRINLNWFADAGFLSSNPLNIYKNFGASAGLNIGLPVFDGHQRKLNYQKLGIQEDSRLFYKNFYISQHSEKLRQLNDELTASLSLAELLKKQEKAAGDLCNLYREQLDMGNVSITELVNAMKNHISFSSNLNQLQIHILQLINDYNYMLSQ